MREVKYKAMLENNDIFINFIESIFNSNIYYNNNVVNRGKNKRLKKVLTKEVIENYLNLNYSVKEIAVIHSVATTTIYMYMKKYNLKIKRTLPSKEYLINNQDKSYSDIARTFNISKSTVQRLHREYNIKKNNYLNRGFIR